MAIHVLGVCAVAVEPVAHELGVEAALDAADETVAHVETDLVLYVAAIGQDDDVAGLKDDRTSGRALVRERMDMPGAPMIEAARGFGIAVLDHGRIFAELNGEIGAAGTGDAHGAGPLEPIPGIDDGFLEADGCHQFLELIGTVDDHQHPRAGVARLLQPASEQGNM